MKRPKDVWETSDGKLHRDRYIAKRHEAWLELRGAMRGLASVYCNGTDPSERDAEMARFVVLNGDTIRRMLRAKPSEAS